ncbi:hypothetical protein IHE44_0007414 [Lamprotornis superbus]|uniref:Uncharacterized protein n=1 Tax=Lamprotornis superbus TaxID=245042 RepID=A0A835NY07_9PASS|nr:hypothetical protein IHE44_0007414 [Lamprotornis superbus]
MKCEGDSAPPVPPVLRAASQSPGAASKSPHTPEASCCRTDPNTLCGLITPCDSSITPRRTLAVLLTDSTIKQSLAPCLKARILRALNAGTQLLKSQLHELPLPWAPPAGAAAGGSGIVSLAQDAACAGKDFSLTGSCSSIFHPPCAWKEEKATATTAKGFLRFKGKRVAAGAVFIMASGLLVYPFGFNSATVKRFCENSDIYYAGDCQIGWGQQWIDDSKISCMEVR